ncbi:hypothetical protein M9458_056908 [Cirrhinus mrigala]|uniref:Uncharacterized protein n=1 Tax=Cirrhinus mrigala TaxID=683832 RepID=A0ABD0MGC5_CIRMR
MSPEGYYSFRDGSHFKENVLLNVEECRIALGLYIEEVEVANPTGTSKKKHKLCAIYWVLANLDSKYRSALHSIQLALLCKVNALKEHGYDEVLRPLIQDIATLEENGVYVEQLAESVKGTILYVAADNLGAHSLAGFQESFAADYFCRFCMCKQDDMQDKEVRSGVLQPRTRENHERHVQEVLCDHTAAKHHGVKRGCPLNEKLTHFHVVNGFPHDILHDFLEGIVPAELSLQFPYTFSDKADKPQTIPKTFFCRGTTGGNGHENWSLLRLLPLMIGYNIPEGDQSWERLMLLKDVLELVMSPHFTEELIHFLDCKISEHRELLQKTFPNYKLRPKHHFIEHYAEMIKIFGPLVDMWTMRFEGKHKFFKKVVHDTCNLKNVACTLAVRHQKMMAFHLDSPTFFKPPLQIEKVRSVMVTSFPENVQSSLHQQNGKQSTVLVAPSACVHGVKYCADMIFSVGSCSGLPEFRQITHIVVINTEVLSWYTEHLRAYELCFSGAGCLAVTQLSELNDAFPYQTKIQEKCNLQFDLSVMYEDSNFDNAFCNLEDIGDLPSTRATVKVIPLLVTASTTSMSDDSSVSEDTAILPTHSSSTRHDPWPEIFDIPRFPVDVEFRLRQANLAYLQDKTYLNVPRDMKHTILEKLAEEMYKFDGYPNEERINSVALAHPCLQERGSPDGLKFKMGNYRTKLRKADFVKVGVNGGKTGGPGMAKLLVEEMKKLNPSASLIASKMDQTFSVRRREIVDAETPVKALQERDK